MNDKRHNLFSLAQEQGYETYWLSSQESKLLTYLGRMFIDHVVTRENRIVGFMQQCNARPVTGELRHEARMLKAYDNTLLHWGGVMDAFSRLGGESI